jgi:Phospholipase_D-nuclease N-terminal
VKGAPVVLRVLPALVELGLLVFCLIDCIQQPDVAIRNLPKWGWVVLIILVPLVGSIAYLVAGRPAATYGPPRRVPWPTGQTAGFPEYERPPRGPDDDADYLRSLRRVDNEHEAMLRKWEDDLRRREDQLNTGESPDSPAGDQPESEPPAR